jgi:serine/threonine-protein kinase
MPGATSCPACGASLATAPAASAVAQQASSASPGDPTWGPVVERLRSALANEFDFEGELGHGGMAAVFRARELSLNRRVAIKVMAPGLLLGEGMVERFRQEAITVANLQHGNIVAVHGVRTVGDLHLFVMQYVPGRSLDRVLRDQGALSLTSVRAIMYHVGSALDYAHRRGVIHRDIKPANILLDADGDPVVTDFGIAKVAETTGYTRVGTVVGTPAYMSPEQCMGHDVGPASDQYALGIVAYEMLAGQTPFIGNGMAMMRAHTDQAPPPLRTTRAEVPASIEDAVMRMLAKKPEDRFPDLAAAIEAFDAHPLSALGPVRAEMSALAAAAEAETSLAEIVRAPRSPAPASRGPTSSAPASPASAAASPPTSGDRVGKTVRAGAASIALEQLAEPLEVGDCVVLDATPRTESGARADGVRVRWESSDHDVATVDAAGVITAKAVGTTTITAAAGSVRSQIEVIVVAPQVATIDIEFPAEVRCGTRATLAASAFDRHGRPVDAPLTWASRNPTVATVSSEGVLSGLRRGTAIVVVECGDVARAVSITITSPPVVHVVIDGVPAALLPGSTAALRAIVRTARATDDDQERQVEWRSSEPSVATVSSDGRLTARRVGRATVSATCEGIRGEAEVNVVTAVAHSVVIAAPPSPLRLGDRITLEATVYDASGESIKRPVTWRSSDSRVASVDQTGRVTAQAEGWAIVTAHADGVGSPVEVVVRQQVVPVSATGRRESRRLALRWWLFLAVLGGVIALGWRFLRR